jgi:hypothetical protein
MLIENREHSKAKARLWATHSLYVARSRIGTEPVC